jgi:phosphate transport system permease protein
LSLSRRSDQALVWGLRLLAAAAGLIVLLIAVFLVRESLPVLMSAGISAFFFSGTWSPTEQLYNLTPMLVGTLLVMFGAVLIATPLGILSAVFCHFYAPAWLLTPWRRMIELLSGIPSVVYGFWGLMVIVPAVNNIESPGASLLAGVIVLTIMVLPTIALMADASLAAVPRKYTDAAHALGLDKLGTLRTAVLPAAKSGLFTGVILETGRAIGETMAVIMVCGNIVQIPGSVFEPVRTLTANIALEMAYAVGDHRSALFTSGLLLIVMIIALVGAAEWISKGRIYG